MIDLKPNTQQKSYDCGEAVARTILAYHGIRWPRNENAGWPCAVDGTDPRTLESFFRGMGLFVIAGEMLLGDLKHHGSLNRPVACLVTMYGCGHWVVSCGVSRGRVVVCDPNSDELIYRRAVEFDCLWQDRARDGTMYQRWGIAVGKA